MTKALGALLAIMSLLVPVLVHAAVLRVPGDFPDVQQAVDSASAGDMVALEKGIYKENIIINKPITLKAAPGSIIKAADKNSPTVKVTGFGATLEGVTATGSEVSGFLLEKAEGARLAGCEASGNWIGITLKRSRNNTLTGNTADANMSYGIYLEYSDGNLVEMNSANRNDDKGMFMSYSRGNTVRNNNVNLNTWNGIMLWASNDNILDGNRTLRNTYGMVISESTGNELTGNTSLPNIFLILPILSIYIGIIWYLIQRNVLKLVLR